IDYQSGFYFAGGTIPGAILGSSVVAYIPRNVFTGLFGFLLVALAIFLILRPEQRWRQGPGSSVSKNGVEHRVPQNRWWGSLFGLKIGFVASLLGIGGGVIYVPVMVYLLNFTVHTAVATSLFIIAIMALGGATTHLANGVYTGFFTLIGVLAIGSILGAQLGTKLSDVLKGRLIIRLFALALLAVGARLLTELF
ncbi:MAG: sulfite exporter TauE/SafE family protein, partial [bacterium]